MSSDRVSLSRANKKDAAYMYIITYIIMYKLSAVPSSVVSCRKSWAQRPLLAVDPETFTALAPMGPGHYFRGGVIFVWVVILRIVTYYTCTNRKSNCCSLSLRVFAVLMFLWLSLARRLFSQSIAAALLTPSHVRGQTLPYLCVQC